MECRLFDVARHFDPECRVMGRLHRNSPEALRVSQRTADIGAVERLQVETRFGEQRGTVASRGVQSAADGLYPGSEGRPYALTGLDGHGGLERNVVVEILFAARGSRRRLIVVVPGRRATPGGAFRAAAGAAGAARTAAEHLHVVGDDLGRKAIIPLFILPFSGPQSALDKYLRAFAQIFRGDFT